MLYENGRVVAHASLAPELSDLELLDGIAYPAPDAAIELWDVNPIGNRGAWMCEYDQFLSPTLGGAAFPKSTFLYRDNEFAELAPAPKKLPRSGPHQ